jgi:hypothetical protein
MAGLLIGKRVAILASDGFGQSRLEEPKALRQSGATTEVVSAPPVQFRAGGAGVLRRAFVSVRSPSRPFATARECSWTRRACPVAN